MSGSQEAVSGSRFVGRERELAELCAAVDDAAAGRGALMLLVGEPGIGKTTTAQEVAAHARRRGLAVLWGRCHEEAGAPAYWPWGQIVRAWLRDRDARDVEAVMGPGAADIAHVFAAVRERFPALPPPPALEPEQARFRLFDAVTTFLRSAAARQPLVLVLDDLHGADRPSLLLLQFLAQEMGDARLLVLGTYRDVEVGRRHPLFQALGELARAAVCRSVRLRGLGEDDVARVLEASAGGPAPRALVAALHRATEGNPFFVTEIVRLLQSEGRLERAHEVRSWRLVVPEGVHAVLGRRLAHLSAACTEALTTAAAIGREFDLAVLEEVGDLAGEALLAVIEEAVAERVIAEIPGAVGRYAFAHALIREALYSELALGRRVRLHRRIGDALERLCTADPEGHLAELAHHFLEAAQGGGDLDRAVAYAERAGGRATQLLAYEEAAAHYQHALRVLELRGPGEEHRRCDLLLALGEAQHRAGDVADARVTLRRAAELAKRCGSAERLARAALGFGWSFEGGLVDALRVRLLESALEALGPADGPLRARALGNLAVALFWSPAARERIDALSAEAVAMARRLGDTATLAHALHCRSWVLRGCQEPRAAIAGATEILRLAEEAGDRELALQSRRWRVTALLELGDVAGTDAEIAAHDRVAEELRLPLYLWYAAMWRTMRALLGGRLAEAETLAQQALAVGERAEPENAIRVFGSHLYELRRHQGRLGELEAGYRAFFAQYESLSPLYRCGLAGILGEIGRLDEARTELDLLGRDGFAGLPREEGWLCALTTLADTCAVVDAPRHAVRLYDLLLPYAGLAVVGGPAISCYGAVARPLGRLAAIMGRHAEAATHFEEALTLNARMGARPWLALTQVDYAGMLVARGRPEDHVRALALLATALEVTREIGLAGLAERAEALRARCGPPRPAPASNGANGKAFAGGVFRREGEYWTLGFAGDLVRLRDTKGLRYLAHLVSHPGTEFEARDLIGPPEPGVPRLTLETDGPALDGRARGEYRARLAELRAEFDEAERFHDLGRADRARAEIEFLAEQLRRASGLGGRERRVSRPAERARLAVTKAIKSALAKIDEQHPPLGRHLIASVKTGHLCVYRPGTERPHWAP